MGLPAAAFADTRPRAQVKRQVPEDRTQAPAEPGQRLPDAVAERLADLMAADPGLADAVRAQLPAARRDSARDLAAYLAAPDVARLVDTTS